MTPIHTHARVRTRVICLFQDKDAAERARAAVLDRGYALDDVRLLSLASMLEAGVPEDDAEGCAGAIADGGVVLSAFAEGEDQALEIERTWRKLGGAYLYR